MYRLLALTALVCLTGCAPHQAGSNAAAGKPAKLQVASAYQTNLPILGDTITGIADRLDKASGGNLRLQVYDPGKLVDMKGILDAVSAGQVDAGYCSSGFWEGKIPAAPLFSSVPFGPEAGEYLAWMYDGNGLKLYQRMYTEAGFNVKVLICTVLPPETSGWFRQPIEKPEDLKGLKIRFFGLGGQVMQKLGASVELLPGGEIYPALERGRLDATEFSMPVIDQRLGFYKVAKYNYYPGWHQQATILELIVNLDKWNSLSPSQQALLEMACREGVALSYAEGEASQFAAMQQNVAEHGVHNMRWSPQMLTLFRQTWNQVVSEQCAADPFFKEVWEDLSTFRKNYRVWGGQAFLPREEAP